MKALVTAITFLFLAVYTNAQVVKGTVVDESTGKPIRSASVYLEGLSKGTTSNTQGEFTLNTNETKKPLIISYIGYKADTIYNYNGKTLSVKLSPRAQILREVLIGSKNRQKYMETFLAQFIGSKNKDCIIINPEVISFNYQRKTRTLVANASQPLLIHNKNLGYRITYFLSAFSYTRSSSPNKTSYNGNYVFEEDTAGLTPNQIITILKARDEAYYGSRMHFIRSVCAKEVEKNKFIYDYANTNYAFNNIRANQEKLLGGTSTTTLANGTGHFFEFPCMVIRYNGGTESHLSFDNGTKDELITPISYNESNLIWSGKFGAQRVGELLPTDFEPSDRVSL